MKIALVPIEPISERYSTQWTKMFIDFFDSNGVDYVTIDPLRDGDKGKIKDGEFLDVIHTHISKFHQLQNICEMIKLGRVADDWYFLFHDLWFPGIEALAYIRDAMGLKFKITGCLHAGTWDEYDFIVRKGMEKWALDIENGWLNMFDLVFVATQFHKSLIDATETGTSKKIKITGFPIAPRTFYPPYHMKENIVVFPHRLAPEKQPEKFDIVAKELKEEFPEWDFIRTKDHWGGDKEKYYELLEKSKIAVSCALQETWGIAMQEAVFAGCLPIMPNRLSYPEMYALTFLYDDQPDSLKDKVQYFIRLHGEPNAMDTVRTNVLRPNAYQLMNNGRRAIPNMLEEIERHAYSCKTTEQG